ncbi:MAG TPA: STAS domain-containing protein [Acidimicrobiia bacterium]|jgi:anti-anti-sigma factor
MDPTEDFSYQLSRDGDRTTVRLAGELDMASAPALSECLHRLRSNCVPIVVVDAQDLDFCDSSGLDVFVAFSREAREHGSHLVLHAPSPALRRLLELTGTTELFDVEHDARRLRLTW